MVLPNEITPFLLGAFAGAAVVAGYAFLKGYFQHFGTRAASATVSIIFPGGSTQMSDQELKQRTISLHNDIAEFQSRKKRRLTRHFWNKNREEMDHGESIQDLQERSVIRKEQEGEFIKEFVPRLEIILQEYERRNIEPDDDARSFESIRWWAQRGEPERILPALSSLAGKLETEE